ncbi:MAG: beta-galactosidase [Chloroflexi bacterium]|nr:beta-galactosidase [Chloroflexota bacterium]
MALAMSVRDRVSNLVLGVVCLGLFAQDALPASPRLLPTAQPVVSRVERIDGRPTFTVDGQPYFPIGVTYHFTRRVGGWDADLRRMRDLGLNTVRIDLAWRDVALWEGLYRFGFLDDFLDRAQAYGLKVVPVFSYATSDLNTPLWFWLRHWDAHSLRGDGWPVLGDFPSLNHPDYRRLLADYLRATVAHVRRHPAILAYQVLNEPHYDAQQLADYNPYTIAAFHRWLRSGYQNDLGELNAAWGTTLVSFAEANPPTRPPRPGGQGRQQLARWGDWREFAAENLAEFTEFLAEVIKETDPHHAVMVAEMSWWWWGEQPYTGVSPTKIYRAVDVVGYDVYPESLRDEHYYRLNADMLIRYWDKPVWAMELNRKDGNPTAEELRRFVESAIEGGATGVFYFQWADFARDGGLYGLIDRFGREKPQHAAFRDVVRWLRTARPDTLTRISATDVLLVWPSTEVGALPGGASPAFELYERARALIEQGLRVGILLDASAPRDPKPVRYPGAGRYPP